MKVSEITTSVQGLLQDDQFAASRILEAANWLQDEIFGRFNARIMMVSDTLSGTAGDTSIDYPDDMKVVEQLYLVSPTPAFDLRRWYMDYQPFIAKYSDYASQAASPVRNYTDYGNSIRFSAPLLTDITLAIDYVRNPVRMVRDSDVCEIPDKYREVISRGTLARCMEQNEDYAEAEQERQNLEPLITNLIRREAVGMNRKGPFLMKKNRRSTSMSTRGGAFGGY